jgi:tRNA-2-methylthio-N6-dimethylallyladenosine synthase
LRRSDGKSPFVQLLEAVHAVDGLERLRFTSPHPIGFREDLIQAFAELPKLMPHVHLPMQSGSDRILKAMHRGYTGERYFALVEKLRAARPDIALTTDIIVGFPGESEEDYFATRELVERSASTTPSSSATRSAATPRFRDGGATSGSVKELRNQDLLRVVDASAKAKGEALVGNTVEILCEGASRTNEARLTGRTPGNKIVIFEGSPRHIGEIFDVAVTRSSGFSLYGDPAVLA